MSDQNPDHDEPLRAALEAEVEGITASPDLLERIRTATAAPSSRRRRAPWLLAVAAVLLVAGIAAVLLSDGDERQTVDVVDDSTTTTTTSETTTTTVEDATPVSGYPEQFVVVLEDGHLMLHQRAGGYPVELASKAAPMAPEGGLTASRMQHLAQRGVGVLRNLLRARGRDGLSGPDRRQLGARADLPRLRPGARSQR